MPNENLFHFMKNKYSQTGQDGIIEKIFEVLQIKQGCFVEFGAWDGIYLSNCRKLYEEGWSGVFIEADPKKFTDLEKNYAGIERITCVNARVETQGAGTLDDILSGRCPGHDIDFLSIDVDGLDLEIFESIRKYLPKVVCLEGGKGAHPFDPRMPADAINCIGQSLKVISEAAAKKGYRILCAYQDVFLVREEFFSRFHVSTDLKQLYLEGMHAQSYSDIPMYSSRLKWFMRKNRILEYILAQTSFQEGEDTEKWALKNKEKIAGLLNSLPDALWNAPTTAFETLAICVYVRLRKRIPESVLQLLFPAFKWMKAALGIEKPSAKP